MSFGIPVRNGLGLGLTPSTALSTLGVGGRPALFLNFVGTTALDSRITFTRASTGRFTGSNGLIQSAAINAPRFDYDPVTLASKGLLIEEQRTNLVFPADGTTGWQASPASSVTATANAAVSPDGTTNATKLATGDTLNSGHIWFKTFTGAVNTLYCGSVYLKASEYTRAQINFGNTAFANTTYGALFDLSAGAVVATSAGSTATITNAGNGYYRCTVTATSDADGGNYVFSVSPKPASVTTFDGLFTPAATGLGVFAYGIQVEAGAFATSYIPTVAATVTRSADVATMAGTNFSSWYNQSEGTIVASADSTRPSTSSPATRVFSFNDGTAGNDIRTGNTSTLQVVNGGVTQANLTPTPLIPYDGTAFTFASAWSANNFASVTTGAVATDTAGTIPAITQFSLGTGPSSTGVLGGHIRSISYYRTRLPNSTLQALTS